MVFDRLYDIFIGIYILAWIGGHRFTVCLPYRFTEHGNLLLTNSDIYVNVAHTFCC